MRKTGLFITAILLGSCLIAQTQRSSSASQRNKTQPPPPPVEEENPVKTELSVGLGGGISTLLYDPAEGAKKISIGPEIDFRLNHYFNKKYGIATGLDFSIYRSKYNLDYGLPYSAEKTDNFEGNIKAYRLMPALKNYEEKQSATYLSIPIAFLYKKTEIFEDWDLVVAPAVRFGFCIGSKFKTDNFVVARPAYFYDYNITFDDLPEYGFGDFKYNGDQGKLDFGFSMQLGLDIGLTKKIDDKNSVTFGIYANYGLNNINKNSASPVFTNNAEPITNKNVFSYQNANNQKVVDDVKPFAVGIKIAYNFNITQYKEEKAEEKRIEAERLAKVRQKAINDSIRKEVRKYTRDSIKKANIALKVIQDSIKKSTVEEAKNLQVIADSLEKITTALNREERIEKLIDESSSKSVEKQVEEIDNAEDAKYVISKFSTVNIGGFSLGKADLKKSMDRDLELIIALLKKFPEIDITLYGHSCNLGTHDINMKLGMDRATQVKNYMISYGIDESRITTISKGDSDPLVPNTSEENRLINRRVTIQPK